MPTCVFDYSIIRLVPRVERQEFLNVGVLLSCPTHRFLQARIDVDVQRLKVFAPTMDVRMIQDYLRNILLVCEGGDGSGPIGKLSQRERFHWLTAPRSTMIQFSPVHSGLCKNPAATLERLLDKMVRLPVSH